MAGFSHAQSNLPACPTAWLNGGTSKWSNCFGSVTFKNGNKYAGEWKDGQFSGQGTFTFSNGSVHVGQFKEGGRHGQGNSTHANGDKFVGEFKNDRRDGKGTYTWANGNVLVSDYKDDESNGQSTFFYLAADQFKGNILVVQAEKGRWNGLGTYTWPNGTRFVGEWKDNHQNGLGIKYLADGTPEQSGQWSNLVLVQSFPIDKQRFPFDGSKALSVTSEKVSIVNLDLNSVPTRIDAYITEAQRLKDDQKYSEACNFLSTAAKLIKIHGLENRFGANQINTQRDQTCQLSRAKNERELKEAVNRLNALTTGPDGRPNIFLQEMLGCRVAREECLRTSNYEVCILQRAPSCR